MASVPSRPPAERVTMSLGVTVDLALCGVLLAGLSFVAQHFHPELPRLTFFTGVAGGALCILWSFLGRRRVHCHRAAILTLAATGCVFARQALYYWASSPEGGSKIQMAAAVMTLLVVFCVGMVANLGQESKSLRREK